MDNVINYLEGMTYEELVDDKMRVDAVLRNIQIIGEAARNVSDDIKEGHPEIPWKRIVALRNIVVHAYFGVDLGIIWRIGTDNIPQTKILIAALIDERKTRRD